MTDFAEGRIPAHRWSKDGSRLLLTRDLGQSNLWIAKGDGSGARPVTDLSSGHVALAEFTADESVVALSIAIPASTSS